MISWLRDEGAGTVYKVQHREEILQKIFNNCTMRMYTEDRYYLVLARNWVGTRVPLRFWTNGTVIGFLFFYFFFFFKLFFDDFFIG